MRLGILGIRGFVGAALARHAQEQGIEVAGFGRPDFDLTDRATWGCLDRGLDVLVHAAGGHATSLWDCFRVNLRPCEALAEHLNHLGLPRLVYLSTGRVYGYHPHAAAPDHDCTPDGDYPVTKYLAERVLADSFKGRLSIARLYYPYGPGQKPPRVFPRLAAQIAAGQPVRCAEDGGPRLSVSHVDDLCQVLLRDFILAQNPPAIANVASPQVLSIAEIATLLGDALGKTPEIIRQGPARDEFSVPYDGFPWRDFQAQDVLG